MSTTLNNLHKVKANGRTKRLWTDYLCGKKKQNVDKQKHSPLFLQPREHCGAHVYLSHHIAYGSESLNSNLMFGESSAFSILIFFFLCVSLVEPEELQCMKPWL